MGHRQQHASDMALERVSQRKGLKNDKVPAMEGSEGRAIGQRQQHVQRTGGGKAGRLEWLERGAREWGEGLLAARRVNFS